MIKNIGNTFQLNRYQRVTSQKLYTWHGSLAGNHILLSTILLYVLKAALCNCALASCHWVRLMIHRSCHLAQNARLRNLNHIRMLCIQCKSQISLVKSKVSVRNFRKWNRDYFYMYLVCSNTMCVSTCHVVFVLWDFVLLETISHSPFWLDVKLFGVSYKRSVVYQGLNRMSHWPSCSWMA